MSRRTKDSKLREGIQEKPHIISLLHFHDFAFDLMQHEAVPDVSFPHRPGRWMKNSEWARFLLEGFRKDERVVDHSWKGETGLAYAPAVLVFRKQPRAKSPQVRTPILCSRRKDWDAMLSFLSSFAPALNLPILLAHKPLTEVFLGLVYGCFNQWNPSKSRFLNLIGSTKLMAK